MQYLIAGLLASSALLLGFLVAFSIPFKGDRSPDGSELLFCAHCGAVIERVFPYPMARVTLSATQFTAGSARRHVLNWEDIDAIEQRFFVESLWGLPWYKTLKIRHHNPHVPSEFYLLVNRRKARAILSIFEERKAALSPDSS